jgi:hypothetical protein
MPGSSANAFVLARLLATDTVAADTMAAMTGAGVDAVLIKGPTLAGWLYPEDLRTYVDADVLVDPARYAEAEEVLRALGFVPAQDDEWVGSEFQPHARPWVDRHGAVAVDLHRTLPGLRTIGPPRAWSVLRGHREHMLLSGRSVTTLDEAGRLLLVALHAHHHGVHNAGRPQEDLARAIDIAGDDAWRSAAGLAVDLDATAGLTLALRSQPGGEGLADRIGLPSAALAQTSLPGVRGGLSMGIDRLASTPGLRGKAGVLAREITPSPSYLRYSSRRARRGPGGLAIEYLMRPFGLLRHALPSLRTWYRTRR